MWSWLTWPGAALGGVVAFFATSLAAVIRRGRKSDESDGPDLGGDIAPMAAFGVTSAAALVVSLPSVLKIFALGLPVTVADVPLVGLGVALGTGAWPTRAFRANMAAFAYALLLVFMIPALVVRLLS